MKLSMITISYNAEKEIEKTILSVLRQSVPVYEYILVDGKSSDRTNEIIESYRQIFQSKNILFKHISEEDDGISDAFNKGIKIASGELIGLINADDELLVETNAILQKDFDEEYDVFYGNCIWVDEINGIKYIRKASSDISKIRYEMVMIHPSTFIKKDVYEKYGLYDVNYKYCMDEDLLTRLYENGLKFKYIDEKLTIFRAGGVSDAGIKRTLREGLRLALNTEKPEIVKAYYFFIKKTLRYEMSKVLKKMKLYKFVKKDIEEL